MQRFIVFILIICCTCLSARSGNRITLPRTIVTTDGEIDDKSSFVRYLMYCNEFETVGLIYTNSMWQKHGHGVTWMQETIDEWDKTRDNLLTHKKGYPTADELKSVVYAGNMDVNYLDYHGPLETEGARHIIQVLLDDNPQPVWIQAWGGTNTIAQALSILKRDYKEHEINYALSKLYIFAIADQDQTAQWIRKEFPEVFYIQCHQFTALNYQHEGHPYSNDSIFSENWMSENVKQNHGPLGASYPQTYFSEGDSPAFFHLIRNGLRAYENPTYGGWGGRFMKYSKNTYYSDAIDDGDKLHGQWIWLKDIQNDFAARMDWCVKSWEETNHYPKISQKIPESIKTKANKKIVLNASGSKDPDGDELSFYWKHYCYAGDNPYPKEIVIQNANSRKTQIVIPDDAKGKEIHIILTVTDSGEPALKQYKRIIIEVEK